MRILIIIFCALVIAIGVASLSASSDGQLIIALSDWTIQTSLTFFVITFVLFFIFMYFLIKSVEAIWNMPKSFKKWKYVRNQKRSEKYLVQGLHSLFEGNWRQAERKLNKGAIFSRNPLINYLGAARAAQQMGDVASRDNYLKFAYENGINDDSIAIGLTQAELQLNQQQKEQALATLKNLHEKYPDHAQVNLMLLELHYDLNDWHEVINLIPMLERKKVISAEIIKARQLGAYAGLLLQAGQSGGRENLDKMWDTIPRKIQNEFYLIEIYTTEKLKFADSASCEPLLRRALKKHWDNNLVRLYGLVDSKDQNKQLKFAENLLSDHALDPVLLLTLGRLSLRNSLWGKARSYLEDSIEIEPMPDAFHELANLLEKQGEHVAANVYYQKGLALATQVKLDDSVKKLQKYEDQNLLCDSARQVV